MRLLVGDSPSVIVGIIVTVVILVIIIVFTIIIRIIARIFVAKTVRLPSRSFATCRVKPTSYPFNGTGNRTFASSHQRETTGTCIL